MGKFPTSGMEMLLWFSWQSVDREKRYTYSSPKDTCYEAPRGLLELLAFGMHTSSMPFLVLTIYHVLTYLIISIMDTYNRA